MSEYTPTTDEVRGVYVVHGYRGNSYDHVDSHQRIGAWREEFDRWLASVKAEAWAEGYEQGSYLSLEAKNPYREEPK